MTAPSSRSVDALRALDMVRASFPFDGYIDLNMDGILSVARTVGSHIPAGSSVLDFGSGPCDKTAALQAMGYRCSACDDLAEGWHNEGDNREQILRFVRDSGIDFRTAVPGKPPPFEPESFDLVMANDVLEHLHDSPRELLLDLVSLLVPNGLLLITVPNAVSIRKRLAVLRGRTNLPDYYGFYWYEGPWRGHVREYTRGDLVALGGYLDLEIVELHGVHHMLRRLGSPARQIYVAACQIFDGWKDSWLMVARRPTNWVPRRRLQGDNSKRLMAPRGLESIVSVDPQTDPT